MTDTVQTPVVKGDPICGSCGGKESEHHAMTIDAADYLFCYDPDAGFADSEFTDEPCYHVLIALLEDEFPEEHAKLVLRWRELNGHPNPPPDEA